MILLMQPHPNNKWFTGDLVRACSQMTKNPLKKNFTREQSTRGAGCENLFHSSARTNSGVPLTHTQQDSKSIRLRHRHDDGRTSQKPSQP